MSLFLRVLGNVLHIMIVSMCETLKAVEETVKIREP